MGVETTFDGTTETHFAFGQKLDYQSGGACGRAWGFALVIQLLTKSEMRLSSAVTEAGEPAAPGARSDKYPPPPHPPQHPR
jgi:hypothetical protein